MPKVIFEKPPDHPSRLCFLHCLRTDYCQRRSTIIQRIILHYTLVCSSLGPKAYVRINTMPESKGIGLISPK